MACLEFECFECGWTGYGNRIVTICPKCSSPKVKTWFDEPEEPPEEDFVEPGYDEELEP